MLVLYISRKIWRKRSFTFLCLFLIWRENILSLQKLLVTWIIYFCYNWWIMFSWNTVGTSDWNGWNWKTICKFTREWFSQKLNRFFFFACLLFGGVGKGKSFETFKVIWLGFQWFMHFPWNVLLIQVCSWVRRLVTG